MVGVLIAIFLVLFVCVVFEITILEVVLVGIGVIAVMGLIAIVEKDKADRVVKAEFLYEVAVYTKKAEHTGFSIGWSWRSGRDYYRYRKVLDHYDCVFRVVYSDGKTGTIRCRKGNAIYNELIRKSK